MGAVLTSLSPLPALESGAVLDPETMRHVDRALADPAATLDLGDAWAGVHYTLSAEVPMPRPEAERRGIEWNPESTENAIMGGRLTGRDDVMGGSRWLSPDETATVARVLAPISEDQFRSWYDVEGLVEADIAPPVWNSDPRAVDWLTQSFVRLKDFYARAAAARHGVLITIE